jgi:hypothetical protein
MKKTPICLVTLIMFYDPVDMYHSIKLVYFQRIEGVGRHNYRWEFIM